VLGGGDGVWRLSDWVVVGCVVVVVIVGGVIAVGRGGGSKLSVMGLTCIAFVGATCVMLEGGGKVSGIAACPSQVGWVPVVGGLPAVGRALHASHLADWVWSGSEGECLLQSGVQELGVAL